MKFAARAILPLIPFTLLLGSLGCHQKIGPPNDQEELTRPENVASFDRLYKQNCSACHGESGSGGPAIDLANANYQALVDDASLKRWITSGMPGSQMPAFGESAGGFLTQQQVDVLVAGMRARWNHTDHTATEMPPYSSSTVGRVENGQGIYKVSCSSCHRQRQKTVTDASYLALVSDQSLRTIVIAGRPDLGHPDWKQIRPAKPLIDQDVSDVVAYHGRCGADSRICDLPFSVEPRFRLAGYASGCNHISCGKSPRFSDLARMRRNAGSLFVTQYPNSKPPMGNSHPHTTPKTLRAVGPTSMFVRSSIRFRTVVNAKPAWLLICASSIQERV